MLDGIYSNPTKVFFGKDKFPLLGEVVANYSKRVLLVYGGKSVHTCGAYDRVVSRLKGMGIVYDELDGIAPNPKEDKVYQGIELCRTNGCGLILAIGGGSAIDTAKAIGIGAAVDQDFFDFFEQRITPQKSLPVGVVLTVPGAGSETGAGAVISHLGKQRKLDCSGDVMFPAFAFLNPEFSFTVPEFQTSCGIVDAISHVLERYFSNTDFVSLTDRFAEGLIRTLMEYALAVREHPENYDIRAEIMWGCKVAHDNTVGFGRKQDWGSHNISHEVNLFTDAPHGAILSVIFPGWMRFVAARNPKKFPSFAVNAMGVTVEKNSEQDLINAGIEKYQHFLHQLDMPENLRSLGILQKDIPEIARRCSLLTQSGTLGNYYRISSQQVENILQSVF